WEISGQTEGDMISTRTFKNGVINATLMWKNGEIPYQLDPSYTKDDAKWIKKALNVFHRETCLRFRKKNAKDKDYIYVHNSYGCFGSVGRQGGPQLLNLEREPYGTGCFNRGTIVHEFLHAAGFYHQHNSPDRDQYVRVNMENIHESQHIQFDKLENNTATTFNLPYNYD
ncbi:metallopeptidase, partial [Oryctes borbonicus]